jgi:signal transduction histidine kinase
LLVSVFTVLARLVGAPVDAEPSMTEALALSLLVGAACRRLPARTVGPLVLLAGAAMALAPVLRFGIGSGWALLAVPAALLWGGGVGTGLVLRDADHRRRADLAAVRADERLALARELHDFVAHHITGIVVVAQGARVVADRARAPGPSDQAIFTEIERAGGEALTAMRRLVGMLRAEGSGSGPDLRRELEDACGNDRRIHLVVADDLERVAVPAALRVTAHRIVLEAVTNARRYATPETRIEVAARYDDQDGQSALVLEVVNLAAAQEPPESRAGGDSGYGLVGMTERAEAVGGTLSAGHDGAGRWRVVARLPLEDPAGSLTV